MFQCSDINISAYHDHALDENQLRQIDIHLQYCPACMLRYTREVRLVSGLEAVPRIEPPKHFIPHVMYRVRQELYSQIIPAEERKYSLMSAGYGLALLILVLFVGGIQRTFFDAVFGWLQLPLKSMLAMLSAMDVVTASGSHLLVSSGALVLPVLLSATLAAGFVLVKLLTRYERSLLQKSHPGMRRSQSGDIS
jgi:predicted anti-sigma-YlaC factor YlaD